MADAVFLVAILKGTYGISADTIHGDAYALRGFYIRRRPRVCHGPCFLPSPLCPPRTGRASLPGL
jgi:hypothetical protein